MLVGIGLMALALAVGMFAAGCTIAEVTLYKTVNMPAPVSTALGIRPSGRTP